MDLLNFPCRCHSVPKLRKQRGTLNDYFAEGSLSVKNTNKGKSITQTPTLPYPHQFLVLGGC